MNILIKLTCLIGLVIGPIFRCRSRRRNQRKWNALVEMKMECKEGEMMGKMRHE